MKGRAWYLPRTFHLNQFFVQLAIFSVVLSSPGFLFCGEGTCIKIGEVRSTNMKRRRGGKNVEVRGMDLLGTRAEHTKSEDLVCSARVTLFNIQAGSLFLD